MASPCANEVTVVDADPLIQIAYKCYESSDAIIAAQLILKRSSPAEKDGVNARLYYAIYRYVLRQASSEQCKPCYYLQGKIGTTTHHLALFH